MPVQPEIVTVQDWNFPLKKLHHFHDPKQNSQASIY